MRHPKKKKAVFTPEMATIVVKPLPPLVRIDRAREALRLLQQNLPGHRRTKLERVEKRPAVNHTVKYFLAQHCAMCRLKDIKVRRRTWSANTSIYNVYGRGRNNHWVHLGVLHWPHIFSSNCVLDLTFPNEFLKHSPTWVGGSPTTEDLTDQFITYTDWVLERFCNGHYVRRVLSETMRKIADTPHDWQGSKFVHLMLDSPYFEVLVEPRIVATWDALGGRYITVSHSRDQGLKPVETHMYHLLSNADTIVSYIEDMIRNDRVLPTKDSAITHQEAIDELKGIMELAEQLKGQKARLDNAIHINDERTRHSHVGGVLFTHR